MNKYDIIDYGTSTLSTVWSIANIQEILGVVLLVISILNIVINTSIKVYKKVKEKKYNEALQLVEDTTNKIQEKLDERNDKNE